MKILRAALIALLIGVVFFFRESIARVILEAFGLGIVLVIGWLGVIVWIIWRRRFRILLRRWNRWLGAVLLSIAGLGIMSFFRPSIDLAGVSLKETSLSGFLGQDIVKEPYGMTRLLGLLLGGVVFIAPRRSWDTVVWLAHFLWWLIVRAAVWLSRITWRLLLALISGLIYPFRRLNARITALFQRSKLAPEAALIEERPRGRKLEPKEVVSEVSKVAEAEKPPAAKEAPTSGAGLRLPPLELLDEAPKSGFAQANEAERARLIEEALASYGVEAKVRQINPGPSVTQFGVEPGWDRKYKKVIERDQNGKPKLDKDGNPKVRLEEVSKTRVKVERITSLANDLALALAVPSIRIEAPVPGKPLVGIEVPNVSTSLVSLRSVIESPAFQKARAKSKLAIALGQGAAGEAVVADLARMPHLLIAGATGSGKTVCLNCIITCLLMQATPSEVRMVLIDPKRVEMIIFNGVPHLLMPVVVEVDKAIEALRRVTSEMDNRYRKFASVGVRNIETYNRSPRVEEPLPYLVVIIDELADLMMTSPDVVEPLICRLAQLARATGIHLVVATQRPSVDVITGLIKANFPTRISFAVVSAVDSRTILDTVGAEKLLGRGDMLYLSPEAQKPKRLRGCFVSDEEMERVVDFWKNWAASNLPQPLDHLAQEFSSLEVEKVAADPFLEKAKELAKEHSHVSTSLLQRKLHIGYPRAAKIMEQLREEGIIEGEDSEKSWEDEE